MFSVKILTVFPDLFPGPLGVSVIGRALKNKIWNLDINNIRDYAVDKHKSVDHAPAGGGSGMIFRPDVLSNAIESAKTSFANRKNVRIIYLSPRGKLLNQRLSKAILSYENIIVICGRFEGIDQRVLDYYKIEEISIGNYILSGGEIAAFAMIDSCVRLIPGVLGQQHSIQEESFSPGTDYENLVEYDQYTKPAAWKGFTVPKILLSGNHKEIQKWRLENAKARTKKYRKDLI